MSRFWLITSTTYGTWLPGDTRGFVSTVENDPGPRIRHNIPGTPCDADVPELQRSARALMKGPPVYLTAEQAATVRDQFLETIRFRGWIPHALSVMANHFHAVVEAAEEVLSAKILGDLKAYAALALNKKWGKPKSGTWWTESGSKRPLWGEYALVQGVRYVVRGQARPLIVWCAAQYETSAEGAPSGGRQPPEPTLHEPAPPEGADADGGHSGG